MEYLAHSDNGSRRHLLADHLRATGELAARFADVFGAGQEARIAGLLHDLGKYGDLFQRRLQGKERGIDHWTAGARVALERLKREGIAAALAIQGHHIGLQQAERDALGDLLSASCPHGPRGNLRPSDPDGSHERLVERFERNGLCLPPAPDASAYSGLRGPRAAAMLDVRMLYSALVDADYLNTEAHFRGAREPGPPLEPGHSLAVLRSYLDDLQAASTAAPHVRQLRADLLAACLEAAEQPPGLFTLTAPTGAGKTLSMLAFALRQAVEHGLRRVVMVIPYLTIIEQTVREYRKALAGLGATAPARYLVEDHSLAGLGRGRESEDDDRDPRRLLSENWDAPIIVTTSVQCLESLFANRPRACRKLHNLARSVILFDEVQTLPTKLAVPTLATLSRLSERYGATVVFSTATQPAFAGLDEPVRELCAGGWVPTEIVPAELDLFGRARRVQVQWPDDDAPHLSWAELADELMQYPQALCVVNLKRHAWDLLDELRRRGVAGLCHLSTSMCPAHRRYVLREVRRRLRHGEPCLLVSTQCVEAGVDVDFPAAFRAWGPLDAIAQVAGRCNRNGKQDMGNLRVFHPAQERSLYPDGTYRQAAAVAEALLRDRGPEGMDISDPDVHLAYYRALYDVQGIARVQAEQDNLPGCMATQHFPQVARKYELIEQDAVNVVVPYSEQRYAWLQRQAQERGLTRAWIAHARPVTVSLYRPREDSPLRAQLEPVPVAGGPEADDWFLYTGRDYDPLTGLVPVPDPSVQIA